MTNKKIVHTKFVALLNFLCMIAADNYHSITLDKMTDKQFLHSGVLILPDNQGFALVSTSDLVRPLFSDPVFPILHSVDLVHWESVSLM